MMILEYYRDCSGWIGET